MMLLVALAAACAVVFAIAELLRRRTERATREQFAAVKLAVESSLVVKPGQQKQLENAARGSLTILSPGTADATLVVAGRGIRDVVDQMETLSQAYAAPKWLRWGSVMTVATKFMRTRPSLAFSRYALAPDPVCNGRAHVDWLVWPPQTCPKCGARYEGPGRVEEGSIDQWECPYCRDSAEPHRQSRVVEPSIMAAAEREGVPAKYIMYGSKQGHTTRNASGARSRKQENGTSILDETAPVALVVHGLVGSSRSKYVRHMSAKLAASGFRVAVFVARGCGGSRLHSPQIFSAGANTHDIHAAAAHCWKRFPKARGLFGCGFSLGGNVLSKALGEAGKAVKLGKPICQFADSTGFKRFFDACVMVSTPFRFDHEKQQRNKFHQFLVRDLHAYFMEHRQVLTQSSDIDSEKVLQTSSFSLFDAEVTVKLNPGRWKLSSDYHAESACAPWLEHIQVPTLFLNALDDPIVPVLTTKQAVVSRGVFNPKLAFAVTPHGGHNAYLTNSFRKSDGNRFFNNAWCDFVAVDFFRQVMNMTKIN